MVNPASKIQANKAALKGRSNSHTVAKSSTRYGKRSIKTELFQRTLSNTQLGKSLRLRVTEHPAKKFYTCTAKTNRLRVGVQVPEGVNTPASMPVDLILIYAKTQRVVEDQSIMCTFRKIHALEDGKGTFEFRIEEVSSRHNRQNFAIKVQPHDSRFKAAYTTGIVVKAKRPKKKRPTPGRWEEPQDEATGGVNLPSLSRGHTANCTSCARFLEDTLMEIREMINTKLEDVIHQIRNCDTLAQAQQQDVHSDGDVDMFHHHSHSCTPERRQPAMPLPIPPMPPVMIPPPLLPPMVNNVQGISNNHHQINIHIGGGDVIAPPKTFQFPLQDLDLNSSNTGFSLSSTPQLHSSDSSTATTPTSRGGKSRERSLTPDEEVMGFLHLPDGRSAAGMSELPVPEMTLPPSVLPTA